MIKYILIFLPTISLAANLSPTPFPVFLKAGFSSVLEFDETPTKVVLGDSQNFQIEKLDRSLVVKTLAPYATGNMFVYFKSQEPKLFILVASEDAEPIFYRKFEPPIQAKVAGTPVAKTGGPVYQRTTRLLSSKFDPKKDYLTVEIEITADSKEVLKPTWALVRLSYNRATIAPMKLWAERQDVQKDSRVKARFIFAKPNIPRNLQGVTLIVPLQGYPTSISLALRGIGK